MADPRSRNAGMRALWKSARVESCANGAMRIWPQWKGVKPYNDEDGGGPGLLSRIAAAELLQDMIDHALKPKRAQRRA